MKRSRLFGTAVVCDQTTCQRPSRRSNWSVVHPSCWTVWPWATHLELQLDACDRTVAVHAHADRPDRLERHEIDAAADRGQLIRTRLGGAGHVDQLQVRGEQPARGVRVGVKLSTEQCPLGGTNLIGRRSPGVRVGTRGRVRRSGKYEDRGGQRERYVILARFMNSPLRSGHR